MQPILAVTIPFFALVLAGWLAGRSHVLPDSAIPGLNAFVLYFALPCLLFRFGSGATIGSVLNPAVLATWLATAAIVVFAAIALSLNDRVGLRDASFGALVAAFPNNGFMGVQLLAALLGPAAAGPVICAIVADLFVTTSACIALAQAASAAGPDAAGPHAAAARATRGRQAAARALRGAVSNPMPWAIAAGVACSAAGVRLVGPLDTAVRMLADAASPVALFTVGTVLWRAGQHAHGRTPARDVVPVVALKNLVHPLLLLAVGGLLRAAGAPLSDFELTVLVLAAALPSASNVTILAERYGADNGRIARIVMASTVLAFATFSGAAWLLVR